MEQEKEDFDWGDFIAKQIVVVFTFGIFLVLRKYFLQWINKNGWNIKQGLFYLFIGTWLVGAAIIFFAVILSWFS